jgi:hypothetical protein
MSFSHLVGLGSLSHSHLCFLQLATVSIIEGKKSRERGNEEKWQLFLFFSQLSSSLYFLSTLSSFLFLFFSHIFRKAAGALKINPKYEKILQDAISTLQLHSKPFFSQGRYVVLHWDNKLETQSNIAPQIYAKWINRFLQKVMTLPVGLPIFVFGSGIETKGDVPQDLVSGNIQRTLLLLLLLLPR